MESPRQNLKRKPLQQQPLLLCQPLKGLLYTVHQPLCMWGVDNREIWPWYISVLSMMQLTERKKAKPGHCLLYLPREGHEKVKRQHFVCVFWDGIQPQKSSCSCTFNISSPCVRWKYSLLFLKTSDAHLTQSAGFQLTVAGKCWEQKKTRALFVFASDRGLKCLTCISWFALKFGMKPRLTSGKQCSL